MKTDMRFEKYLIIVSLGVLILFFIVQYTMYDNVKEQTIRNINSGQMIHARQAASGIQDYMNNVINTLNFLSHSPEIIDLDTAGKQIINNYQQLSSEEINGVTRVDANGIIMYTIPDEGAIGRDISQQEHISQSMKTHKTVISDVFMAVQGFRTVAVHVPVFRNGAYDGTLAFLLSFDKIAQKYIENIRVGESGYAWVVSEKGIEISSPFPEHIGKDVYDIYKDFPGIISMADEMLKGKKGITTYYYNRTRNQATEKVLEHAVYLPISFNNTFWSIVIATPEDEVIASLAGLRTKLLLITIALVMVYVISMYLIIRHKIITGEQKKREAVVAALKESEARYKTLFEQNPAPTLIYERDTFNMLAVNDAFLRHYGYSSDEVSAMRLPDLYPENKRDAIAELASGLYGYQQVGEWRHRKKDGSFINVVACSNDLVYKGCKSRIAVITDVTEREITEEKIRTLNVELEKRVAERTAELEVAKERAESADRLKSSFLATMSHELRTPLNSIIGFTGILMKGIAGPLNSEQLKQLGMAKSSAQHLLELINDVLDISKIEAGEVVVSLKPFELNKTIHKVISSVQPFAEKKDLKLEWIISEDIKEIISDERRVAQILLNLLNNAIKFTDKGFVKLECGIKDNSIVTRVIDTGIGIKKDDMKKLFKPFSQIDTGLARNHDGTGLGLSISSRLVEKLGGRIIVESEVGRGSTFTVLLPFIEI